MEQDKGTRLRSTSAWPCGHPRTEENSQRIGKAGVRCKTCRRRIGREHHRRKFGFYLRNPELVSA